MIRSKYGAVKTIADGIKFDSKAEAEYYLHLKLSGVKIIELQPKLYFTKAKILYKPDFLIEENDIGIYIDVKGLETPIFKLKKRLWKAYCLNELRLVKKKGKSFIVTERINQGLI